MHHLANVTTIGDTTITVDTLLIADPGEVPIYRVQVEPVPTTPAEALAWAQSFGLPDPEVYLPANENDPIILVLGSDGQQLTFQKFVDFAEIIYSNPNAGAIGSGVMPFDEAADIAIAFLRSHHLLPDDYQVEPAMGDYGPLQQVIVRTVVAGGLNWR